MFLHLGENVVVQVKDIIAIFDMEASSLWNRYVTILRLAEEDGFVEKITQQNAKILCYSRGK